MDNSIRFSVIMPTYNRKHCIRDAIDSILKQTYSEFELIIIDDGSDDGTGTMIQSVYSDELKSKKINYIFYPNHIGVCRARNEGLKYAKYDWIAYCDTDNVWYNNFLESFSYAIKDNPEGKCFYAKLKKKSNGVIFGVPEFDKEKFFLGNYIDLGVFVHNKSLYELYGGFDENLKRLVDFDLILTYTKHNKPIFVDKCVLLYNDMSIFPRISVTEDFNIALSYILKKHHISTKKTSGRVKKMSWLRFKKHLGLISGAEYEKQIVVNSVKASKLFNEKWYLEMYPDVAKSKKHPIEHYLEIGWKEGYNPSQKFDNNAYLTDYPDVAGAGVCPLLHYINHGKKEGRYVKTLSGEELSLPAKEQNSFLETFNKIIDYPMQVRADYEDLKSELKNMQK